MANIFAPSIQGDGISSIFFQHLWQKNRNEDRNKERQRQNSASSTKNNAVLVPPLRIPDTVTFQLGQPLQWYFTSERGAQQSIILRKRKQNVNVEKIEEDFLRKCRAANKGCICENDVVAYFIASSDCTLRNRRRRDGSAGTRAASGEDQNEDWQNDEDSSYHSMSKERRGKDDSVCDIEYFNEEGLHNFLYKRRKNQSGILQRFIEPSGGGTHNSQIRAICTPKMCILERRKTKQQLHDSRFGLYERAVTFEGPEVYSKSLPIRGATLPGKLRVLCEQILLHTSEATKNRKSCKEDVRMVLNLKVDSKDRIWLLYSSSIRTVQSSKAFLSVGASNESQNGANHNTMQNPLNVQDVIKLSPKIKLSQIANHDPNIVISNTKDYMLCPSCGLVRLGETFHPVPYKTIVTHYEQVMITSNNQWPPPKDIILSAGGVGFGKIDQYESRQDYDTDDIAKTVEVEYMVIPPVIRHFHKRLKVEGYRRYRSDPLFLHKKCKLCETCFLSYAHLVSTSFQIKIPIKLDTELKRLGFDSNDSSSKGSCDHDNKEGPFSNVRSRRTNKNIIGTRGAQSSKLYQKNKDDARITNSFASEILIPAPEFPEAIIEPPSFTMGIEEDIEQLMPLPYKTIESPSQPLKHLITMHEELEKKQIAMKQEVKNQENKAQVNPYEIPLKFVERKSSRKRKKMRQIALEEKKCAESKINTTLESGEDKDGVMDDLTESRNEDKVHYLSGALAELMKKEIPCK